MRGMLTRSMARAQLLPGHSDGDRLLPAVESSVAAAVRALRQAQARLGHARAQRGGRSTQSAGYCGAHGHVVRPGCICDKLVGHQGAPAGGAVMHLGQC